LLNLGFNFRFRTRLRCDAIRCALPVVQRQFKLPRAVFDPRHFASFGQLPILRPRGFDESIIAKTFLKQLFHCPVQHVREAAFAHYCRKISGYRDRHQPVFPNPDAQILFTVKTKRRGCDHLHIPYRATAAYTWQAWIIGTADNEDDLPKVRGRPAADQSDASWLYGHDVNSVPPFTQSTHTRRSVLKDGSPDHR
jgi:hypothetical protein